jgi:hypothetical protein
MSSIEVRPDGGVVDQQVDSTESTHGLCDDASALLGLFDVSGQ